MQPTDHRTSTSTSTAPLPPRGKGHRRGVPPGLLRRAAAARYCGAGVSTWDRWSAAGLTPVPVRVALLRDLDPTLAERWLADCRRLPKAEGGFGPATSNHYRKSLVAFGNWLVKARRSSENPFRHLPKVNAEVDVRHQRRPLSAEEFARVLEAARGGKVYRRLPGSDRRMLYLVGGATGLRSGELSSLTPESFGLAADPPVVVVEVAYSKHRRRDEVPLHPDLSRLADVSGRPAPPYPLAGEGHRWWRSA